jgi:hypothetical protein
VKRRRIARTRPRPGGHSGLELKLTADEATCGLGLASRTRSWPEAIRECVARTPKLAEPTGNYEG